MMTIGLTLAGGAGRMIVRPGSRSRTHIIGAVLKKLLKLKDWLTVPEAARDLSILAGEAVTEADVLQFALDGRLTLSVRLVNRVTARQGKIVPPADVKIVELEDPYGNTYQGLQESVDLGNDRMLTFSTERSFIEGIWDLSMLGTERIDVEKRYQLLTGGPKVVLTNHNGPLVNRPDGTWWQLVDHVSEDKFLKNFYKSPHDNPANYYAARALPSDAVLVVRTSALQDLVAFMSEPEPAMERPIGQRERDNLLVIIAALAKLAKMNVAKPSAAAAAIEGEAARTGIRVGLRTIEEKLKLIPDALERKGAEDEPKGAED